MRASAYSGCRSRTGPSVQDLLDGLLKHDFACAATSDRVEDVVQMGGNG